MGHVYFYCYYTKLLLRQNVKHRHRRNVMSYRFTSLLFVSRHFFLFQVISFCFTSFLFVSRHFFLFHIISLHYLLSSFLIISYNSFNTMSVYLSMFTTPITIANIISISIINCQNHNFALPPSDTTCNC